MVITLGPGKVRPSTAETLPGPVVFRKVCLLSEALFAWSLYALQDLLRRSRRVTLPRVDLTAQSARRFKPVIALSTEEN